MKKSHRKPRKRHAGPQVGDEVTFQIGLTLWRGVIIEDRGPLGRGGRHLYGIRFPKEPSDEIEDQYTELPLENFDLVKNAA